MIWLLSTLALAQSTQPDCPHAPADERWMVEQAQARGPEAEARAEAARLATEALMGRLCGAEPSPACRDAALGQIEAYGPGSYKNRLACVARAAPRQRGTVEDSAWKEAREGLDRLARQTAQALPPGPLHYEAPTWKASRQSAGAAGATLEGLLSGRLAAHPRLEQAGLGPTLRLELSPLGSRHALLLVSLRGEGEAWRPLGELRLPWTLLFPAEPLGGPPAPALPQLDEEPLHLRVLGLPEGGLACEGEQVNPTVQLSGPADLRIYDLDQEGRAREVHAQDLRAEGPQAITLPTLVATPGRSRLLALAWTPGEGPKPRGPLCTTADAALTRGAVGQAFLSTTGLRQGEGGCPAGPPVPALPSASCR
jgi:hypothetical protein